MLKSPLLLLSILFIFQPQEVFPQQDWQTWYELHDGNQTPNWEETLNFSQQLADASPYLYYTSMGTSHQEREIPLLILDLEGSFCPQEAQQKGRTIVLVQAAIHAGEPVGKDAGLLLLRDIVIHQKHHDLLQSTTLLFIPILNVDGHERFGPYNRINQNGPELMGWRTNALNLNLNRDYLKADSKEIRAFLNLWQAWEPHFFIDTHSTNGGDYQYTMTYAMDIFGSADENLKDWMKDLYIPYMEKAMEAEGYPIFPYVTYRSWHDPRSGLRSGTGHPMFSNGYVSELNRPGLLLETHMLKPYKLRVESTYLMILHTLAMLQQDQQLKRITEEADRHTASAQFRQQPYPLRFENTSDSTIVDFLGVEYHKKQSTLSGGNWFIYQSDKPVTYQIPWFNVNVPILKVQLPEAYIIPVEHQEVIDRLAAHGVEMNRIAHDTIIDVEMYRFSDVQLASRSNEGRQTARFNVNPVAERRLFPAGSVLVSMAQPRARIIAHALEPMAPGSFAYWGFFNAAFERVEYFESYVMESMARDMLAQDPSLRIGLEKAFEAHPEMRSNPYAILSWFYEQTPYYDQQYNLYPVGRILTAPLELF